MPTVWRTESGEIYPKESLAPPGQRGQLVEMSEWDATPSYSGSGEPMTSSGEVVGTPAENYTNMPAASTPTDTEADRLATPSAAPTAATFDSTIHDLIKTEIAGIPVAKDEPLRVAAMPTSRPQPEPPPGMVTVGLNSDGTYRYGPAEPEKGAPSATEVVKRVTGQRGVRMGGVWRNLPEDLRPERLAGGLIVYPYNRADYEARLSQAVQDGAVSPNVAKQVMAGYDKWKRTPWGAMVDYSRLVREDKHIEMESARDRDLISEERNREESNLYRNLEKDQAEAQAAYEEERATYQREMDRLMSTQKRAIDALSRKEIDPNRWWNSQSNFGKVMSALGVTLGAAGSGLSAAYGRSTPNVAYDIMKSAINRDVQSQMADMRNKRSSVGARQSLLGTIMTQVKDASSAQSIARLALLDQAKAKLNMFSANAQGDAARRNAQMLRDKIDNDREILMAELRMNAGKLAARRAVKATPRQQRQPGRLLGPELRKRFIEGEGLVLGGTSEQFEEMRKAFSALNHGRTLANEVTRIVENPGYSTSLHRQKVASNLLNAFSNKEIHGLSGGAVPEGEADRLRGGGLTPEGTGRFFDAIRNSWQRDPQGNLQMPIHNYLRNKELRVNELRRHFKQFPGTLKLGTFTHQRGTTAGIDETATFFDPSQQASDYGLAVTGEKGQNVNVKSFYPGKKPDPRDIVGRK